MDQFDGVGTFAFDVVGRAGITGVLFRGNLLLPIVLRPGPL